MQLSRRELLDEVLDFVGENADASARNTAERLLNRALQNIWMKCAWTVFQVTQPHTFPTVSGQARYALPYHFGRVRGGFIRNITTAARLAPAILDDIDDRDPARSASGTPESYAIAGVVGVATQVAVAGEALEVVSSAAADVSTVKVTLVGTGASGEFKREEFALNGTTAVAVGTWTYVLEFSKAYTAATAPTTELTSSAGTVTLRQVSDGSTRQTLLPYESSRAHYELLLWPTPNVVHTIAVPFIRRPMRMLYDSDMCPLDWGPALTEEMIAHWRENTGDVSAAAQVPRPALLDLLALENSNRFGVPARTKPFQG